MRKTLAAPLVSAALLAIVATAAAAADPTPHWTEVRSPNFIVLTNSSDKDARHIAGQFERMRTVFHAMLPGATDDADSPIIVVALKDRKSFQALEPEAYLAKGKLDLAGYFMNAPDKNYVLVRLDAGDGDPFTTVYHEYTHYMLRKDAAWMPLWLNEGLAEFYQNTVIEDKSVHLGKPSQDDIEYLRQNKLIPLSTLFAVDHDSPYYHDEQKGSVFYSESWALTHFLMVSDFKSKTSRIQTYSHLLASNVDPSSAAQQAFGDLGALQKQLDSYVGQMNYNEFVMHSGATIDEGSFQSRSVPTLEADATRADVLVYNGRTKEAETMLAGILQDDPKSALAHETMGFLKLHENDSAAASKWYGEAVQLGSHSYLAYYYYSTLSMQGGVDGQDEAIESSLNTSIKLNPNFAPSYDALAHFYATHHEKPEEAHAMSVKAISLEPDNLYYRLNAAEVLMQNQKIDDALNVLKAAMSVAKTPNDKQTVQDRITRIQSYQASLAHSRHD
jgi:tetratricopeptide (TPR) repeat protein